MASSFLPALGLLALMVALAWGLHWARRRLLPQGANTQALRIVSQLPLGPQQRVVVVEIEDGNQVHRLALGVTPQQVTHLHTLRGGSNVATVGSSEPLPSYTAVASAMQHTSSDAP